ncbi:MAG: hypothetical protein AB1439_10535 [candidate division FCPU426 bacterium]
MESTLADFWGNTGAALAPVPAAGNASAGTFIWSLLFVIVLLLLLAWGARWLLRLAPSGTRTEPRLLLSSRLGAQTLVLWAEGEQVYCALYRGKQVEFATAVPLVKAASPAPALAGAGFSRLGEWLAKSRGARRNP